MSVIWAWPQLSYDFRDILQQHFFEITLSLAGRYYPMVGGSRTRRRPSPRRYGGNRRNTCCNLAASLTVLSKLDWCTDAVGRAGGQTRPDQTKQKKSNNSKYKPTQERQRTRTGINQRKSKGVGGGREVSVFCLSPIIPSTLVNRVVISSHTSR